MVNKNKSKKKTTKKTYRKKATWSSRYNNLSVPSGMPSTRRAVLRYNTSAQLSSTSGLMKNYTMRANSVFDPDYTSVGHQPMGFDQWSLLFNHYVVLGAKMKVRFMNESGSTSAMPPYYCGVLITDQVAFPYTNSSSVIEAQKGNSKMSQWIYPSFITQNFSAKKYFNVTDVRDNFDRLGASVTANPQEGAYYQIWMAPVGSQTAAVTADITIEYIVEFCEPKDLAQS